MLIHKAIDHFKENNFTFSYPHMAEKVLFLAEILEVEILMILHTLKSCESENHHFSSWSVYLLLA